MFNMFGPSVPKISAEEVKQALDTKKNVTILDVRTQQEYAKAKIAGSLNLPVDQIAEKITNVLPDKKQTIYVYCLSGSRSIHAVNTMKKLGYSDVYDMQNGLLAWRIKKFPLIQGGEK
jgi:rhodanese-related sulfurtransferase